jgi:UDP-3-O-[3-hydroxymyristoyl] glucosamine N-acyltransferase
MSSQLLLIFGARSTALEIAELVSLIHPDWLIKHVVGDGQSEEGETIIKLADLEVWLKGVESKPYGIISMSNHPLRMQRQVIMEQLGIEPVTLIHPDATVSPSAVIGGGSYIAAGCRVSTNAQIGAHSMLNLNVTFGHDAVCGTHTVVNPAASISGNVCIGNQVLVGASSFIYQGLSIGDECQIDAMTYVWQEMPARHVATSRNMKLMPRIDLPRD